MNQKELTQLIIEKYQEDERIMIQVFAQWCVNEGLDAEKLYEQAYPSQGKNKELAEAVENTSAKGESAEITASTLIEILQLFGNDDLAFVVAQQAAKKG